MNVRKVDGRALADGTYYFCAGCGHWFGKREPASDHQCPGCRSRWEQAHGTYTKATETTTIEPPAPGGANPEPTIGCQYFVIPALLLGAVCWVYSLVLPALSRTWSNLRVAWSNFKEGAAIVLKFIGDAYLAFGAQSAATLLMLGLFAALFFLLVFLIHSIRSLVEPGVYAQPTWRRAGLTVNEYGRAVGTFINLLSNLCALMIVAWLFQRPLDFVDFGLQFMLALIIEYVILHAFSQVPVMA